MLKNKVRSEALIKERSRISTFLRDVRKAHRITLVNLSVHSGLTVETIRVIEGGRSGNWTIDSQIIYQLSLIELMQAAKEYDYVVKNYPKYSIYNVTTLTIK